MKREKPVDSSRSGENVGLRCHGKEKGKFNVRDLGKGLKLKLQVL